MYPYQPEQKWHSRRIPSSTLERFLLILLLLSLSAMIVFLFILGQELLLPANPGQYPTPSPIVVLSPYPSSSPFPTSSLSPTRVPTPTQTASLAQRIDAYIAHLTQTQQIGQLLMLPVYASSYTSSLNQPLQQWDIANAILYNQYDGGPLMPATLSACTQLVHDLKAHANQALIIATDEEGGDVDRLAPYYGRSPSPQWLAETGNPQLAYAQAQLDAQRMRAIGINTDLAPLADVYQEGAVDQSRMFGITSTQVVTYAGAFLDGLQQNGVVGTLKHWPGIGSASVNPDYGLPTIYHNQQQLNVLDFASFRSLLSHQPGMIMVTHAMIPAYDSNAPASLSPVLINQVLRGQLGYQGVVITDAMGAQGLLQFMQQQGYANPAQAIAEASIRAILAGDDIILCPIQPERLAAVVTTITAAVQSGRISQAHLRQSLRRIITLKVQMGLITLPA